MKDEHGKDDDVVDSESRSPNRMMVPGLEALAGPLIMKLGPFAGREIYGMIAEGQALSIRVEESWMVNDDFYAMLRFMNLTAHGVYVEKIACSSEEVDVFFSRSKAIFESVVDFTGKADADIEWRPLSAFTPMAVEMFSEEGFLLALKIEGVDFRQENRNPLWQRINSLKFTVDVARLDLAKRQERVVEVMLRHSGRK